MSYCTESTTDITGITGQIDSFVGEGMDYTGSSCQTRNDLDEYARLRRYTLANALDDSGQRVYDGTRIDPKTWDSMVRKYVHGGHYEYVVGRFGPIHERNTAKTAFDEDLMPMLHSKKVPASPIISMRTAFTDRSARMREGLHGRNVMVYKRPHSVDAAIHKNCNCASCNPFDLQAAGVSSHRVHYNKMNKFHTEYPDTFLKDMDFTNCPKSNTSGCMNKIIHKHDDPTTHIEVLDDEILLGKQMGRKAKQAYDHYQAVATECKERLSRSQSGDLPAGRYNRMIGGMEPTRRGRQDGQPSAEDNPPARQDMHMIMTPRCKDPSPSLQVTPTKKHKGDCRTPSDQCEKLAIHNSEEIMRYEVVAGEDKPNLRSASLPPYLSPSATAHDRTTSASPRERNVVNHKDWDEPSRRPLLRATPSRTPHATAAQITNQIGAAQQADDERAQRLTADKHFADICSLTEKLRNIQAESMASFRQKSHHSLSTSMATSLRWQE